MVKDILKGAAVGALAVVTIGYGVVQVREHSENKIHPVSYGVGADYNTGFHRGRTIAFHDGFQSLFGYDDCDTIAFRANKSANWIMGCVDGYYREY